MTGGPGAFGAPDILAPGKVFLIGEYAVLEGGPAVIAAVARRARARFVAGASPSSPVVAQADRTARAALAERSVVLPAGAAMVDSGALGRAGDPRAPKLGLGSSAAVAVAAVGATLEAGGLPVASNRDLLFALADHAHRAAQGGVGSGADVAAAVYGGVIRFVRPGGPDEPPRVEPIALPTGLELVMFATPKASSTPEMIRSVRAFAARAPGAYAAILSKLRGAAEELAQACRDDRTDGTIRCARTFSAALDELGRRAGVDIVAPPFHRAATLATELGGAAKPSGAGGGDLGLAFLPGPDAARAFRRRAAAEAAIEPLDLPLDLDGGCRRAAAH